MPISKQTAMDIALAHREIDAAEALLADIVKALSHREQPDIRDAFGRSLGGLQLGVPSGKGGHSLFNVPWTLARPVIEAHIAQQHSIIAALNEKARIDLDEFLGAPTNAEA
jgi:hypothetical protein